MQEELNHIEETLCLTPRFNTDRPETVFDANTNLLVPPTTGEFIADMITHIAETDAIRDRMHSGEKLYGNNVGERIVEFLQARDDDQVFDWTHERAGIDSGSDRDFEYL